MGASNTPAGRAPGRSQAGPHPPGGSTDVLVGRGVPFTHDVTNQATPLVGHNVYGGDRALRDALAYHVPGADEAGRGAPGALLCSEARQTPAPRANGPKPPLPT